jgi:hypothetical protein
MSSRVLKQIHLHEVIVAWIHVLNGHVCMYIHMDIHIHIHIHIHIYIYTYINIHIDIGKLCICMPYTLESKLPL